jgi:amino acid transporter
MQLRRSLTVLPLVFVMYFNTSGGAFTTEGLVAQVGPGLALLTLLVVPLVWSLPEVLIVGELASMLPEEGGYYRWVRRAFGPFWGFQNAWCTYLYSLVDMAIYPVLFNQYLAYFAPGLGAPAQWAISLAVIWGAAAINLRGALPVGRVSVAVGAFVIGGFLALALLALPNITHAPWRPFVPPGRAVGGELGVALSVALWNYSGWDNASTVQGEVRDATRTYPRALALALPLVAAGYFVPLLATLGATDWTRWTEGGWPAIAVMAVPGALGGLVAGWLALAGMASALALFNALLLVYTRVPLAVAADGLLPATLSRTDARGTPRNAILVSSVLYSLFALLPFASLIVADVLLYAIALFMEFAALVALRRHEPALRGAFRIPLGTVGVALLALLPVAVMLAVVALGITGGEFGARAIGGALLVAAVGPLAYRVASRR